MAGIVSSANLAAVVISSTASFEKITGIHFDGGYAEYVIVPAEAVALMPEDLRDDEAAPLLCAGITVFNALRNSGARAGQLVAVQGIGGLGHLGIQYARQMGFRTVAIGRGSDKKELATKLGAHEYIDNSAGSPAEALQKMGGASVVVATAPDSKSMSDLVDGLGPNGTLMVIGAGTGIAGGYTAAAHFRKQVDSRMGLRNRSRFPGHAGVQRPERCSPDDRTLPAGEGR